MACSCRDDLVCGQHSGFPPCCIGWYVYVWIPFIEDIICRGLWSDRTYDNLPEWGYVPCPSCRATGARVHVKRCPPRS